jgi:protoporphyrinogen oxidase
MKSKTPERWAVLGGGLLGMTLALRLARSGREVTLFDGAERLGGLASAWSLGDVVWDRHYHVTLLSDTWLASLLSELDLEDEVEWVETRTGFYVDGKLYSMSNTMEFLKFPPLSLSERIRLGATIFYASRVKNWRRLEAIPVTDWLRRLSGPSVFEKIWLPLLRAKLGENYRKASAAFIWATIARMYAARRTGLKREMFGYVKGGYGRVLERFAEVLSREGVGIKLGHRVSRVAKLGAEIGVQFENGSLERFDRVVLSMAAPIVERVCDGLSEDERARLKGVQYQGIICASALLKRPLGGYYVTNITDSDVPFTAVIEMTALVDPEHFGGRTLVYLPKYVTPNDGAFDSTDSELESTFIDALIRMYPDLEPSDVLAFRVSRERHVLALSTIGYSDRLPPLATTVPGVFIVNSAHIVNGTLNVNETVQLAERAARELVAASQALRGGNAAT